MAFFCFFLVVFFVFFSSFFIFIFFFEAKKTFEQDGHVRNIHHVRAFLYGVLTLHSVSRRSVDD